MACATHYGPQEIPCTCNMEISSGLSWIEAGGISRSGPYGHFLEIFAALKPPTPLPFRLEPLSPVKV
jgi:hypothetical protein